MGARSTDASNNASASAAAAAAAASPSSSPLPSSRGETPSPSPSPSPSPLPFFFSRFTLPGLRSRSSRARNLADFHIRPAEPHRKYVAGDHVQGAVILTIIKPVRITHLTVALHGYVRVYKNPSGAQEPVPFNPAEAVADGPARFKYYGNGHVSLFQDEQVLSADGRLEPGKYEFNFDLMFPPNGLPSSIDFERGTISYMITATLTRPATILPTTSCERKIYLVEQVDVGHLAPPRPRTISLEPISKRTRRKKPAVLEKGSDPLEPASSDPDSGRPGENSGDGSAVADDASQDARINSRSPAQSDIRSEISGDSIVSGSTGIGARDHNHPPGAASSQALGRRSSQVDERTITATINLQKGGSLPGDVIPVKISVQHIKRIKSMHGVIVTLYRQGRIDSAPPPSMFTSLSKEGARRLEKEEYYPKSKTGLGGLSLSSASSCSVFRKDLCQAFSPLIIDPTTMSASVTTSVRVPEDAFPSIRGVPGEMISFKYQLEVIVDLGGKLASQIQGGGQASSSLSTSVGVLGGNVLDGSSGQLTSWSSGNIVDTDHLRREKGVISVVFEIIVGTTDSTRRNKSALRPQRLLLHNEHMDESGIHDQENGGGWQNGLEEAGCHDYQGGEEEYQQYYQNEPVPFSPVHPPPAEHHGTGQQYPPQEPSEGPSAPHYISPPEVPDESGLTEKERVRRAEQRLLPSQPPATGAVAVTDDAQENIYDAEDDEPPAPPAGGGADEQTIHPGQAEQQDEPSAPALEDLTLDPAAGTLDDKEELERQRLLAEASAPPEFPDDCDGAGAGSSRQGAGRASAPPGEEDLEPSAPALTEEEQYGEQYAYGPSSSAGPSHMGPPAPPAEPLPKYER